jgi:hypothetical protein
MGNGDSVVQRTVLTSSEKQFLYQISRASAELRFPFDTERREIEDQKRDSVVDIVLFV